MRATAFILGIVVIALGCDKTASKKPAAAAPALDLAAHPDLVFHVFGERTDPRMMPVAAISGNSLVAISLPPEGWRQLDAKYLSQGTAYPLFRDGLQSGTVTVERGMWSGEPLYTLPGCASMMPMAKVSLGDTVGGNTVEEFATTRPAPPRTRGPAMPLDSVRAIAWRVALKAAKPVGLDSAALSGLDFHAVAIETHAYARPTIVSSFIDPRGGDVQSGRGKTADVLVIADDDGSGYKPSFSHAVNGDASHAEYRSYLDHANLTGGTTDEILLDGWKFGEETSLRVLAWRNGTWHEVFQGRSSWCTDAPKK